MAEWFGLPIHEILIPTISWVIIIVHHLWLVHNQTFSEDQHIKEAPSVFSFFAQARVGWVSRNHLTGQASANSTRDYLRVLLFYQGNSIVLSTLTAGYCAANYNAEGTPYSHLLTAKLGFVSVLFMIIFLVMVYAVRYGTHFHMMMNVEYINGLEVKNHLKIIEIVYHKAHFFYSTAQRMYFLLIPAFAWLINSIVLALMTPVYIYLINVYEDISWMQEDIDKLTTTGKDKNVNDDIAIEIDDEKDKLLADEYLVEMTKAGENLV